MKKIKLFSFACLPLVIGLLAGCGHQHTFSEEWVHDNDTHWHPATCEHTDVKGSEGAHVDSNLDGYCDVCEFPMPSSHVYGYSIDGGTVTPLTYHEESGLSGYIYTGAIVKDQAFAFYVDGNKITSNITLSTEFGDNNFTTGPDTTFVVLNDFAPEFGEPTVALFINGTNYKVFANGFTSPTPEVEYYAHFVTSGDKFKFEYNEVLDSYILDDMSMPANTSFYVEDGNDTKLSKLTISGPDCGFSISEGTLTSSVEGKFNFKLDPTGDGLISIEMAHEPSGVALMGSFDDWTTGIEMNPKELGSTEYVAENVKLSAGDEIKVKAGPEDTDYVETWKLEGETSAFNYNVCYINPINNNAGFIVETVVNIYYESNTEAVTGYGVYIEYKGVISHYKGEAFMGSTSQGKLTFAFNYVDVQNSIVEYKLINAPAADGLSYEIQLNDTTIDVSILENCPQLVNFTSENKRFTYHGKSSSLNFYLKHNLSTDEYTCWIEAPAEPGKLYLNTGGSDLWEKDGAYFAIWDCVTSTWAKMEKVQGKDNLYSFTYETAIPGSFLFARLDPQYPEPSWDVGHVWNQTNDIAYIDNFNYVIITGYNQGDFSYITFPL